MFFNAADRLIPSDRGFCRSVDIIAAALIAAVVTRVSLHEREVEMESAKS